MALHLVEGLSELAVPEHPVAATACEHLAPEEETAALLTGNQVRPPDAAAPPPADEARARRTSIAVLPFRNLSAEQAEEYFVDGIVEEIIAALSRVRGLMVIGRNSSFSFRATGRDARQIAADLGVRYILVGSFRKAGSRVRVTAQLIDGSDGGNVWDDRMNGDVADVFALHHAPFLHARISVRPAGSTSDTKALSAISVGVAKRPLQVSR